MNRYWEDDVVRNSEGQIGRILRVGWDDEQSDNPIPLDAVEIVWSAETKIEVPSDDWTLLDRTVMKGDIVVKPDQSGDQQTGTVTNVYVFADIANVYGEVKYLLKAVPSTLLSPVSEWRYEIVVSKDGWAGIVQAIYYEIQVKLDDFDAVLTFDTQRLDTKNIKPSGKVSQADSPFLGSEAITSYMIGTNLMMKLPVFPDKLEGDKEWSKKVEENFKNQSREEKEEKEDKPQDSSVPTCYGLVTHMKISTLRVNWVDHAVGGGIGRRRPAVQQKSEDVISVDTTYHTTIAKCEITWIAPMMKERYLDNDHFEFPDGTRLERPNEVLQKIGESSGESGEDGTAENDGNHGKKEEVKEEIIQAKVETVLETNHQDSIVETSRNVILKENDSTSPSCDNNSSNNVDNNHHDAYHSSSIIPSSNHEEIPKEFGDELKNFQESFDKLVLNGDNESKEEVNKSNLDLASLVSSSYASSFSGPHPGTIESLAWAVRTHRFADIKWQDNSVSLKVPTTEILPYLYLGENDFQPNDFVQYVPTTVEEVEETKLGVVQFVDHANRVATIRWCETNEIEPMISIYMLEDADESYSFRIGYYVLRRLLESEGEVDFDGMIGLVQNMNDGKILVKWSDLGGKTEWYDPKQLIPWDPTDYDNDPDDWENEEDDEEEDNEDGSDKDDEEGEEAWLDDDDEGEEDEYEEYEEYAESEEEDDSTSDYVSVQSHDSNSNDEANGQPEVFHTRPISTDLISGISLPKGLNDGNVCKEGVVEPEDFSGAADIPGFEYKEAIPLNHHYLNYARPQKNLVTIAMKEWKLLSEATLSGAYVHAYEERVDSFRFIVLGAQGTPFYLSWFMFDLRLDVDYPSHPPHVFFKSLGPKLHPNLYEDGNVCLSLLGTWNGDGVENWDPQTSNILQVVLSIQGLVLGVKDPYYLEAGYDRHRGTQEGKQNSIVYNERAFLLSFQQMKKLIEHPPPEFSKLIKHSLQENRQILMSLEDVLSTDPEVLSKIDLTIFGLQPGPPSLGFRAAFKAIFPPVKKALQSL